MDLDGKFESEIFNEITERVRQYRISCEMTQSELADKAFVAPGTVARFERGKDISLLNFIKIMKALGLESNMELLIPDHTKRPSYYVSERKEKQRVRKNRNDEKKENTWKWGDEE
ncbi:helix-turn-helix transcriptional regulator [Ruminococcus sp. HUN007]|uniref:helix-turn-helix domain-containing protein n=1 Tax=Ruminococcus sp. HUN007 TaxID=1514668 RepID=UPI0005D2D078|nr:helix-turn-helix transcriptional regulator [Ruminococcus sp. HUN007]